MSRPRGGFIGYTPQPAASALNSAAGGIWTLREAESLKRAGTWPAAPVNPTSVAGLQLWLDASDAGSLYDATTGGSLVAADGGVARWEDKSGNGRHATQSTAGSRPARKTAIQGGKDVLRFDGSNDFITSTVSNISNCTIFAVFANRNQSIGSGEIDNVFAFGPFPAAPNNKGIALNSSNVFGSNTQRQFYDEVPPVGATVTLRKNGNTSPLTINLSEFCVASFVVSGVSSDLPDTFSVGRLFFESGSPFYGQNDIGEVIVYNTNLSNTDRQAVENYLLAKWGIT